VVFTVDFCNALGLCSLPRLNQLESRLLSLIEFQTAVPMGLYARYCFALQDCMQDPVVSGGIDPDNPDANAVVPIRPAAAAHHGRGRAIGHRRSGSWSGGDTAPSCP
jgi:hypothetical protein